MKKYIAVIIAITFCLLSGCATMRPAQTTTAPTARIGLKLAPATLGESLSLQQHLTVQRAGHTYALDTVLQINPQQLDLIGLAFGQRVMTLQYDGKTLQTWRHPRMPPQISGENVLEDIELTLWPAQAIRAALPAGWQIADQQNHRVLSLNHLPVVVIDYVNTDGRHWGAKVVLTNLRYHYQLTIQSAAI